MDEAFEPWELAAYGLVTVGAINWGVKSIFGRDLVGTLLGGEKRAAPRVVYGLVGVAGVATAISVASHLLAKPEATTRATSLPPPPTGTGRAELPAIARP